MSDNLELIKLAETVSGGGNVLSQITLNDATIRLPASGGIQDSSGNNVLTESGGTVTFENVVFPAVGESKISSDLTGGGNAQNGYVLTADGFGGVDWREGLGVSSGANLAWNSSTDTYAANTTVTSVTTVHQNMRRCVLNALGEVVYYLDATDSTRKADGNQANLDGQDGNVMVEIQKFWFRQTKVGDTTTWEISDTDKAGFSIHPAFYKNGNNVPVNYRYIGAYQACYYDVSESTYKSGLNLEPYPLTDLDLENDKLASVSGVYPISGVSRAQCRSLAENNGTGWHVCDFYLMSAVQLLYLVEYGTFNTQSVLGAGNTADSYVSASYNQSDSPHSISGRSDSLGNVSTNPTTGASTVTDPPTAFMSYRGIENWYGNCFQWIDGINIGVDAHYNVHVSNNYTNFEDDTSDYYDLIGQCASTNGYAKNILNVDSDPPLAGVFIPSTTGGSSSTYLTDQFYVNQDKRAALFGGYAQYGAAAGGFFWIWDSPFSAAFKHTGSRIAF